MNFSEAYSDLFKFYCRIYEKGLKNIRGTTYTKIKLMDISDKWGLGPFTETICGVDIAMSKLRHFDEYYSGTNVIEGYTKKKGIKEGDVVVDAGAYPGEFTVYAAKKGQKVIALEPDNENSKELRKNLELNELDNFEIRNVGLGAENKEGFLKKSGVSSEISKEGSENVEIRTMDSMFGKRELDFIKMDIEGKEVDVIKGSEEYLQESSSYFAIAAYHEVEGKMTANILEEILESYNYSVRKGFLNHYTLWASKDGCFDG